MNAQYLHLSRSVMGIVAFGACAATAGAAGISYSSPMSRLPFLHAHTLRPTSHARGWLSPEAKSGKNLMYVSSQDGDIPPGIYLYSLKGQDQPPIGMITNGTSAPQGISTDATGNLYVANNGNNTVTEYAPGQLSPSTTYSQGMDAPMGVAAGSDGTVYVADTVLGSSPTGNVTEYAQGQNSLLRTLTLSGYAPSAVALDSGGNLYVAWFSYTAFDVLIYKYAPGSSSGRNLNLDLPGQIYPTYALAFDPKGNLNLWYETLSQTEQYLAAFPPGSTEPATKLGTGDSLYGFLYALTFSHTGRAYLAIPLYNEILEINPPKDIPLNNIILDNDSGIALSPGS